MNTISSDTGATVAKAAEYLAFTLGQEEYGIDIQKVSEIRSYETPTRIANAPEFVKGVVNLRGIIVPIVGAFLIDVFYQPFTIYCINYFANR